jgi:Single-strand binding protein family
MVVRPPCAPQKNHSFADRRVTFLARPESKTTWHHVLSFNPGANNYLRNLQKGSHVYVEANFELRDPDPAAEPGTPQGQRQILLRHGK